MPTSDAAEKVKKDPKAADELAESVKKWVADKKIKYKHLAGGVEFMSVLSSSGSWRSLIAMRSDVIPKNPSGPSRRDRSGDAADRSILQASCSGASSGTSSRRSRRRQRCDSAFVGSESGYRRRAGIADTCWRMASGPLRLLLVPLDALDLDPAPGP